MPTPFTRKRLTDVKDSAPEFGFGGIQEARFARSDLDAERTGIEVLAVGAHHDGDGEIIPGWWSE